MNQTYNKRTFPAADCPSGYPWNQIEELFDEETLATFNHWMNGQTMMICEGRRFNHETREYEPDECVDHPHGGVVYTYDLHRFLGFLGRYHQQLWD